MLKSLISTLAAVLGAVTAGNAFSQDLNAMNAEFNARMNAQMQASTASIVQKNMNNPQVRQQYQVYLQQAGTLDFPSSCGRKPMPTATPFMTNGHVSAAKTCRGRLRM